MTGLPPLPRILQAGDSKSKSDEGFIPVGSRPKLR